MSTETNNSAKKQRAHFNSIAERYFAARNHSNHLALKGLIWKLFFARNPCIYGEVYRVLEPMRNMGEDYKRIRSRRLNIRDWTSENYARDNSQETKSAKWPSRRFPDFEYSPIDIKYIRLRYS
jgi:hypothetical protein